MVQELGSPSKYENYGSFDTAFYQEEWIELYFEFGRLRSINFGVLYDEDDNPLWPSFLE
ncbi:MAG: hypothetical protein F6K16_40620 [Symploca sp. SIO2B6]|nr:hypothetical protein [Symploca sp. SIO2B6]